MATLTALSFPSPGGAEAAVATLEALQDQGLINVHDAATVSWPPDRRRPETRHLSGLAGTFALGGAFWGLLFGLVFFVPLLGVAAGAAAGAAASSLVTVGIDDAFIASVRAKVQPGTSAVFAMTSDAVLDEVREAFRGHGAEVVTTNLSGDEEARLREVFAD
jgi:uncharacterized membrane protein